MGVILLCSIEQPLPSGNLYTAQLRLTTTPFIGVFMSSAHLLILIAVLLPPKMLDILGEVVEERTVLTPYGEAGMLARRAFPDGLSTWVQPYTGLPTRTDPRATLYAARQLGVKRILNWDMGIAINPVLQRGLPVVIDDYIAWISHQADSFFVETQMGEEANLVETGPAFCPEMTAVLQNLLPGAPTGVVLGADFLRRETPAEARMFRLWGADVLSYNLVPEVSLAREMGICYSGLVTVSATAADRTAPAPHGELRASLSSTVQMLPALVEMLSAPPHCSCQRRK